MRNRLLLSLLMSIALVYFAVPYLPEFGTGLSSMFSFLWLAFALLVIGGNFSELLFRRQRESKAKALPKKRAIPVRRRSRQY
jgi:hypothetical protein